MNVKKLAIIGAIALVVVGCVIAAGCTSSTTQQTQTSGTTSNIPWIGMWGTLYKYGDGTSGYATILIKEDGTAIWTGYDVNLNEKKTKIYEETWKQTGENKITLTNPSTGKSYNYEYISGNDTLSETNDGIVNVYNRLEPILGTWGTRCIDYYSGCEITTFLPDGTGKDRMIYLNEKYEDRTFTWTKTGFNTYKLTFSNGDVWQAKFINDEEELEWELITLKDPILGTRTSNYEEDGKQIVDVTTFKDDFTGFSVGNHPDAKDIKKITKNFTWKKNGPDTYILDCDDGTRWYAEYNSNDNTIDYELIDLSDEPIVGTHTVNGNDFGVDGTTKTTFYPNGTGKEVQTTKSGISFAYDSIWNKTDTKNEYSVLYFNKNMWELWTESYDPQTKTLNSKLNTLSWVDNYRVDNKHHLDVHYVTDGTGIAVEFDADGNMKSYNTIWDEYKPNAFRLTYDDGDVWYVTHIPATDTYEWRKTL